MKISKYTTLFENKNSEFYIYSSLSNALIEIEQELYLLLLNAQKKKLDISNAEFDDETYDVLISKKMIVDNDCDSFLYYKSIVTKQRADKSNMHLTIAPTMDCCFKCSYCFEKNKTNTYMSEEVMNSIITYLNSLESRPDFKLTWFGGEPLMALSQMQQFYNKLAKEYKKPINSNIITTGFHINEDSIKVMTNIGIQQVQITLDGLGETHNKVKYTSECTDVFNHVLDNTELLLSKSDINVVFRVNLTKKNSHEYVELYNFLINRFKPFKKKGISPAFVMDRGINDISIEEPNIFFTPNEISQYVLDLYNKYGIHSPFLGYPSRNFNECAIKNIMSMSFDPEGYAYKCWEVIGSKRHSIGKLNTKGVLENINEVNLNRHLYGADPLEDPNCSKCKYLPICNGGCPIQRLENIYENSNNCCCTFYKGHLTEYLNIHLALKKMGIDNKYD